MGSHSSLRDESCEPAIEWLRGHSVFSLDARFAWAHITVEGSGSRVIQPTVVGSHHATPADTSDQVVRKVLSRA